MAVIKKSTCLQKLPAQYALRWMSVQLLSDLRVRAQYQRTVSDPFLEAATMGRRTRAGNGPRWQSATRSRFTTPECACLRFTEAA